MRNKISEGEISLRKRYLKTLIARVVVGERTIRIQGERSALAQSLADQGSVSDLRRCVPKWRTRSHSSANAYLIELPRACPVIDEWIVK
jgi:hypothetical protein